MNFLIVGGGCFGTFYARQLLRGGDRLGLGAITLVDRDPNCRAVREIGRADPRLSFIFEDWKTYLLGYFSKTFERFEAGEAVEDHYVPPTFAPHVLLEVFLELARRESPKTRFEKRPCGQPMGTPVDMSLPNGTRALSFATWMCPASCIEPPLCPHTRGPKDWDMRDFLKQRPVPEADALHVFQCRHYTMGVGTIPVETIAREYAAFRKTVRAPGTRLVALATVSSCHGLLGLVEVQNG